MRSERARRAWLVADRLLLVGFLVTAALNMLQVRGGFMTSHAADVVVPAWLYVETRGLHRRVPAGVLHRLVGWSAERTAALIFLGSTATEVAQRFWPHGPTAGRYDPADIVAFGVGVGACYLADRLLGRPSS